MALPLACVLTTIQSPTSCVIRLHETLKHARSPLIVIGDKKGPASFELPKADFYSLDAQLGLPFDLATLLPQGHYSRKNLGYLLAIERGAQCIYETDDDNHPSEHWAVRSLRTRAKKLSPRAWANVYRMFTDGVIWPRGFPLERITDATTFSPEASAETDLECPIQQGLADLAPDVDAVWRLVQSRDFYFERRPSVWLAPGTWCPFNSQTTWWWPVCYPLLYLPSFCSFRMTDIWRSFIAQRCLWELGHGLVFHAAEAIQLRNEHNLLRDFNDEVPGYQQNGRIARELTDLKLEAGPSAVAENLIRCCECLTSLDILGRDEMPLVRAWVKDLARLNAN